VSLVTVTNLALLLATLVLVRDSFPVGQIIYFDYPFEFLIGALSLTVAGCSTFPILVFFGQDPHFSGNSKNLLIALIVISFFLFYGGLLFWSLEGWPYENAVMFCLVTITSVGYGNNCPSRVETKLITIFFAMLGLAFIGFAIEQFRLLLVDNVAKRIAEQMTKLKTRVIADGPPPDEEEEKGKRRFNIFAMWGKRSGAILALVSWWLCGSAIFMTLEGWDYLDAFYFSFITLSTIGYGDFYPTSAGGMIFLIFYILSGLGLFAFGLSTLGDSTSGQLDSQLDNLWGMVSKTQDLGTKGLSSMWSGGGKVGSLAKNLFNEEEKGEALLMLVKTTSMVGASIVLSQAMEDPEKKAERELREQEEREQKEREDQAERERLAKEEEERKKPRDVFKVVDREKFDELSQAVSKSLKKLLTCEPTAVDAWLRDYRKRKAQFEETFLQRDPAEVAAEMAEKGEKDKKDKKKDKKEKKEKKKAADDDGEADGEEEEEEEEEEEDKKKKEKKSKKDKDKDKDEKKDKKEKTVKDEKMDDPDQKRRKSSREGTSRKKSRPEDGRTGGDAAIDMNEDE